MKGVYIMRISPINNKSNPGFNANLYITKEAKALMRNSLNTSRWDVFKLELKLSSKLADEVPQSDTCVIDKISKKLRDELPVSPFNYGYEKPQFEVRIQDKVTGFYFNTRRTISQIAEDMYNAYKHVRYLKHYAPNK